MGVFFLFLVALAGGAMSSLFWVPEDELGSGYFKVNALVILGLLSIAAATYGVSEVEPFGERPQLGVILLSGALIATLLYYAAIWREAWTVCRWPLAAALGFTTAVLLISGPALVQAFTPLPHRGLLLYIALITSAALLGWSLVTMLLGHWYLVVPQLSFGHLEVYCKVLLAIVLARSAAVAATVWVASTVDPTIQPHPLQLISTFGGQGMFFWFRILWGLAMPLLLGWMALDCARRDANQSATGILYVLLVGSFIGDITALYLTLSSGVPL